MLSLCTLSQKGQIVIPADVRKEMSLSEGDIFMISKNKNTICLLPLNKMQKAEIEKFIVADSDQ